VNLPSSIGTGKWISDVVWKRLHSTTARFYEEGSPRG
jgi:hypothetical protein